MRIDDRQARAGFDGAHGGGAQPRVPVGEERVGDGPRPFRGKEPRREVGIVVGEAPILVRQRDPTHERFVVGEVGDGRLVPLDEPPVAPAEGLEIPGTGCDVAVSLEIARVGEEHVALTGGLVVERPERTSTTVAGSDPGGGLEGSEPEPREPLAELVARRAISRAGQHERPAPAVVLPRFRLMAEDPVASRIEQFPPLRREPIAGAPTVAHGVEPPLGAQSRHHHAGRRAFDAEQFEHVAQSAERRRTVGAVAEIIPVEREDEGARAHEATVPVGVRLTPVHNVQQNCGAHPGTVAYSEGHVSKEAENMRIAVIGAGPAGLLLATLVARDLPSATVDLFERNGADEAFGFGVVFSDATQRGVDAADSALRTTLDAHGVRWDAIEVRLKDEIHSFAGNGMGAVLRKDLLAQLQQAAADAGVNLHFRHPVDLADLRGYDIVAAADGANSRTRQAIGEDVLGTSFDYATAKFIWFATDHSFDGLTFLHQHVEGLGDVPGVFAAHAYPIGKGLSTFIVETDEATWRAAGLDDFDLTTPPGPSDEHSRRRLEEIFAPLIDGAQLIGNNSRWGNFRTVRSERWHAGNVVFLGDAVHTAHFSVGSGTKMAIEDAIALAEAIVAHPDDTGAAFTAYESVRQPAVARIQNAARPSLSWWENFGSYYHAFEPWQFAFHFFSRSLPTAKIARRDPAAAEEPQQEWVRRHGAPALASPLVLESGTGDRLELAARLIPRADLADVAVLEAPLDEEDLDAAIRSVFDSPDAPRAALVTGGTPLTRQLASEAIRLRHGASAVIHEPDCDDDRALTLVLSGRADAVAR